LLATVEDDLIGTAHYTEAPGLNYRGRRVDAAAIRPLKLATARVFSRRRPGAGLPSTVGAPSCIQVEAPEGTAARPCVPPVLAENSNPDVMAVFLLAGVHNSGSEILDKHRPT
jgi:hypothetical protein